MTSVQIGISLPPELAERAREMSKKTGVPLSTAIQRLLEWWLQTGELPDLEKEKE